MCENGRCEVHPHMMHLIEKLEIVTGTLMEGQSDIKENIVKLTENLLESRRMGERLDKALDELKRIDKEQGEEIKQNSAFVNKAIGVVGSISLLSALGVLIMSVLTFFFNQPPQ